MRLRQSSAVSLMVVLSRSAAFFWASQIPCSSVSRCIWAGRQRIGALSKESSVSDTSASLQVYRDIRLGGDLADESTLNTISSLLLEVGALSAAYRCAASHGDEEAGAVIRASFPPGLRCEAAAELAIQTALASLPSVMDSGQWSVEEGDSFLASDWHAAARNAQGFSSVCVGAFQVVPVQVYYDLPGDREHQIRLLAGEGWGNGQHPTTRLCLDFLSQEGVVVPGDRVVDYGTGSGVLAIAAVMLGARECVGVDVCYDSLASAAVNVKLNSVDQAVELIHPRSVVPGQFEPGDVVLANILVGTLLALADTIISLVKPGAWLCLSGLRPEQAEVVRERYAGMIEFETRFDAVDEAVDKPWGSWVRLAGRRKFAGDSIGEVQWIEQLSEAALGL